MDAAGSTRFAHTTVLYLVIRGISGLSGGRCGQRLPYPPSCLFPRLPGTSGPKRTYLTRLHLPGFPTCTSDPLVVGAITRLSYRDSPPSFQMPLWLLEGAVTPPSAWMWCPASVTRTPRPVVGNLAAVSCSPAVGLSPTSPTNSGFPFRPFQASLVGPSSTALHTLAPQWQKHQIGKVGYSTCVGLTT